MVIKKKIWPEFFELVKAGKNVLSYGWLISIFKKVTPWY